MEKMTSHAISDKVFDLTEQFHRYVFDHPEILDDIPDKATLVFLDPDDPEFNRANVELSRQMAQTRSGSGLVYIEMRKQVRVVEQVEWTPHIKSLPLAA
jgi:hypothetical protein